MPQGKIYKGDICRVTLCTSSMHMVETGLTEVTGKKQQQINVAKLFNVSQPQLLNDMTRYPMQKSSLRE